MKSTLVNLTCEIELQPGEKLVLPEELANSVGAGRWVITIQPVRVVPAPPAIRQHSAFLNGYAPEDEGRYEDDSTR